MSVKGIIMRGAGALAGRKIAEETGKSGVLGTVAGFGLTMLARRSPLGLLTVGGLWLGKKYLDSQREKSVQPVLPLAGGDLGQDPGDRFVDANAKLATDARDPGELATA